MPPYTATPNELRGEAQMSYQALDESTTALAKWFLDQGLQPGDRVAVHWTNSIPPVQLLYAHFKAVPTGASVLSSRGDRNAPDVHRVISYGQDGRVILWNLDTLAQRLAANQTFLQTGDGEGLVTGNALPKKKLRLPEALRGMR